MMHNKLIQKIKNQELKGIEAHQEMSPVPRPFLSIPDTAFRASVLILLFPKQENWHFPLIQRNQYEGVHSGQISLPGGKEEMEDMDAAHTALRETFEEIGIPTHQVQILRELTSLYIEPSNFVVRPFVGIIESNPQFILDSKEVDKLHTINLNQLTDSDNKSNQYVFRGRKVPAFNFGETLVWGATACILNEFRELVR